MSRVYVVDAAKSTRAKLIESAVEDQTHAQKLVYRGGLVLKDIKDGLVEISNSPKKMAMTLCAGALIGFFVASGTFSMEAAKNELAAAQTENTYSLSASGSQDSGFDKQIAGMHKQASSTLERLHNLFERNPELAKKCQSGSNTKACQSVRNDLAIVARLINTADELSTGYGISGGTVADSHFSTNEKLRSDLKKFNIKYPGIFTETHKKQFDNGTYSPK